ncbi:MAG: hypothetical protein HC811_03730 [Flammeovirgaceae bacterium]|nr:hypothetical protein [Flammeovirgaceae bacterium]
MTLKNRFSNQDLERIKAAVHEAETKSSGEIVPVFVERSGFYTIANYRAGLVLASLMFLFIIVADRYLHSVAVQDPLLIMILVAVGGIAGAALSQFILPVRKLFISQAHMDQATKTKAENAFLEEEVFNTRHRTGIMIFISFFEQEVIVMADRGISKVVEQKEWDNMVKAIIAKIKSGHVLDGILDAVKRGGDLLLEKGFVKTKDDVNELRNDLRIEN